MFNNKSPLPRKLYFMKRLKYNSDITCHNKNKGFTLAEVLITLGIIGVIAALTLPTLITNYKHKVTATRLEQTYSILSQAIRMSEAENGEMKEWDLQLMKNASYAGDAGTTKRVIDTYLKPYIKTIAKTKHSGAPYTYYNYNSQKQLIPHDGSTHYCLTQNNGVIMCFDANYGVSENISTRVDINGENRPNVIGVDIFFINIYPNFGFPQTSSRDIAKNECKKASIDSQKFCGTLIKLDGWEIKSDYPWQ